MDIFSKAASNSLLPWRLYNYKIQLMDGTTNDLSYTPLYYQLVDEL
jgi:hypothetical protein